MAIYFSLHSVDSYVTITIILITPIIMLIVYNGKISLLSQ